MRTTMARNRGRTDEEGVSNVVSLIMIAGILVSLLGMVFATYLPAWGKDIEVQTMNGAMDSFMDIKSGMDTLAVGGDPGTSLTTKMTLGSTGGPIFGFGRSTGSMDIYPDSGIMVVRDSVGNVFAQGRGALIYDSSTTYVEDQKVTLESGAIIREQAGTRVLKGPPNLMVKEEAGSVMVYMLLSTFEGTDRSITGTSSHMVTTTLLSEEVSTWNVPVDRAVEISITTENGDVWADLFTDMMGAQGFAVTDYTVTQGTDVLGGPNTTLRISANLAKVLELRTAVYQVSFN